MIEGCVCVCVFIYIYIKHLIFDIFSIKVENVGECCKAR